MKTLIHCIGIMILLLLGIGPTAAGSAADKQRPPLDVTYVANEGFLIQADGKKVLVDALFDNGSGTYLAPSQEVLSQMTAARGPFADVDLLLVTHPHGDHFNPKLVEAYLRSNPRCRLVAHTQTVDQLRKDEGFAQIRDQIHEVNLDPGARESITINGIAIDVLVLSHVGRNNPTRNLAFIVNLGGTCFLHMGDAIVENSLAHLNAYPFDKTPVDVLFLGYPDRSQATQQFIARKIKPSRIIAMHVPPAELEEESKKIRVAYPHAIVFKQSMERHSLPIEADFHNLSGAYLGQPPPDATPEVFARGIVSTDYQEHGSPSFSPDGNEVYWYSNRRPGPENKEWLSFIMTMRRENGRWSASYVAPQKRFPIFSADGRRAYFSSARPHSDTVQVIPTDLDIWFIERQGDDWSQPKYLNLVARYPELRWAGVGSVASNGTLYFMSYRQGPPDDYGNNFGIYRAELIKGEYTKPELLTSCINLLPFLNWTPFIAPDESYLIFSSSRGTPKNDGGDLYVSFRQPDDSWTNPVSLGKPINTDQQERFPRVSWDGKYLFFSRWTPDHDEDVFWVSASIIGKLKAEVLKELRLKQ